TACAIVPCACVRREAMQLEDYFDFQRPDDIRIKGTRVGIETVLLDYLHRNLTAEQIAERYPSVSLEQVYATILYYLREKPSVEAYLSDYLEWKRQAREEQARNPSPAVRRALRVKEELAAYAPEDRLEALRRIAEKERRNAAETAEVA